MVKFAHIADVHLGGWKQQPLQDLNFKSFETAFEISIKEKVNFVLIAGDLFDTAYPPIETLKRTFLEFRKLKDAKIPCFIIAGSHDYSVSGKTFLDVLEKAGFFKNVAIFEEKNGKIYPDLQWLAVCSLASLGYEDLLVYRENTFGHPYFSSYRFAQKTQNDKQKLRHVTVIKRSTLD